MTTLVIVSSCTVLASSRPAGADQISDAKAKAAQIQQELQQTGQQIDALDQQYEAAQAHKHSLDQQMSNTQDKINQTQGVITKDRAILRRAVVNAYMTGGEAATQNPLFSGSQASAEAAREYNDIAEGSLSTAVANLHTAENQLDAQKAQLSAQDAQAQQAVDQAQSAYSQAQTLEQQQQQTLNQVNAQITQLIKQQQEEELREAQQAAEQKLQQAAAAATQAAKAQVTSSSHTAVTPSDPPPPSNLTAGEKAVYEAKTYLTVPYRWGGASRTGVDCSGLTMLAWDAAGVQLPHYSGGQYQDSAPVPLSDLEPGDLLFYGPGGATHVAMYVGTGEMIEAPYTGAHVWITGLRTGTANFAGAGRP